MIGGRRKLRLRWCTLESEGKSNPTHESAPYFLYNIVNNCNTFLAYTPLYPPIPLWRCHDISAESNMKGIWVFWNWDPLRLSRQLLPLDGRKWQQLLIDLCWHYTHAAATDSSTLHVSRVIQNQVLRSLLLSYQKNSPLWAVSCQIRSLKKKKKDLCRRHTKISCRVSMCQHHLGLIPQEGYYCRLTLNI